MAPPPPPETFGAYSKKSEESGGIISMMDMMIKDMDTEMLEAKASEKEAQKDLSQPPERITNKKGKISG